MFTNNDSVANVFLDDLDSVPEEDPGLSSSRFALNVNEDVRNSGLPRLSSSRSIRARNVMILLPPPFFFVSLLFFSLDLWFSPSLPKHIHLSIADSVSIVSPTILDRTTASSLSLHCFPIHLTLTLNLTLALTLTALLTFQG